MRMRPPQSGQRRSLWRDKTMLHALEVLSHHEKPGFWQQVMDVGNAPGKAVLARKHRQIGARLFDRLDRVLEGLAGQRRHSRVRAAAGKVGIGAG